MEWPGGDRWVIAVGWASFALSLIVLALVVYSQLTYRSIAPLHPVAMIIPLIVLLAFFLRPSRLPGSWPRELRERDLEGLFRQAGHAAKRGERGVTVRLGKLAAVTFPVDQDGSVKGTYLVDATPSGYSLIIIPILLWPVSAFSIPLTIRNVLRARKFVFAGPPGAACGSGGAGTGPYEGIKPLMVDNLSELYRISSEAYESARSDFQDRVLAAALLALAAWAVIFVAVGLTGGRPLSLALLAATLVPPLLAFAAYLAHAWRTLLPRVERTGRWAEQLGRALRDEAGDTVAPEDSSLQTALEALPHLPEWLGMRRRSLIFRHPGTGLVMLSLFVFGLVLAILACGWWTLGDIVPALLLAAAAGGGFAAGSWLYLRQARKDRAEAEGSIKEFRDRMDQLDELLGTDLKER